ncbi:hypothetical protein [Devosia sp. Root436]|jgi:hypothetical protein|nr:hypothetical protein [Devosia sp. Root436]
MNQFNAHSGSAPGTWLQHHMPWLSLLALVLNLFRDDPEIGFDPDDLNG